MNEKVENFIYKIKGREYILLERILVIGKLKGYWELSPDLVRIGVILKSYVGVEQPSFFRGDFLIVQYLVPVNKIKDFDEIIREKVNE